VADRVGGGRGRETQWQMPLAWIDGRRTSRKNLMIRVEVLSAAFRRVGLGRVEAG